MTSLTFDQNAITTKTNYLLSTIFPVIQYLKPEVLEMLKNVPGLAALVANLEKAVKSIHDDVQTIDDWVSVMLTSGYTPEYLTMNSEALKLQRMIGELDTLISILQSTPYAIPYYFISYCKPNRESMEFNLIKLQLSDTNGAYNVLSISGGFVVPISLDGPNDTYEFEFKTATGIVPYKIYYEYDDLLCLNLYNSTSNRVPPISFKGQSTPVSHIVISMTPHTSIELLFPSINVDGSYYIEKQTLYDAKLTDVYTVTSDLCYVSFLFDLTTEHIDFAYFYGVQVVRKLKDTILPALQQYLDQLSVSGADSVAGVVALHRVAALEKLVTRSRTVTYTLQPENAFRGFGRITQLYDEGAYNQYCDDSAVIVHRASYVGPYAQTATAFLASGIPKPTRTAYSRIWVGDKYVKQIGPSLVVDYPKLVVSSTVLATDELGETEYMPFYIEAIVDDYSNMTFTNTNNKSKSVYGTTFYAYVNSTNDLVFPNDSIHIVEASNEDPWASSTPFNFSSVITMPNSVRFRAVIVNERLTAGTSTFTINNPGYITIDSIKYNMPPLVFYQTQILLTDDVEAWAYVAEFGITTLSTSKLRFRTDNSGTAPVYAGSSNWVQSTPKPKYIVAIGDVSSARVSNNSSTYSAWSFGQNYKRVAPKVVLNEGFFRNDNMYYSAYQSKHAIQFSEAAISCWPVVTSSSAHYFPQFQIIKSTQQGAYNSDIFGINCYSIGFFKSTNASITDSDYFTSFRGFCTRYYVCCGPCVDLFTYESVTPPVSVYINQKNQVVKDLATGTLSGTSYISHAVITPIVNVTINHNPTYSYNCTTTLSGSGTTVEVVNASGTSTLTNVSDLAVQYRQYLFLLNKSLGSLTERLTTLEGRVTELERVVNDLISVINKLIVAVFPPPSPAGIFKSFFDIVLSSLAPFFPIVTIAVQAIEAFVEGGIALASGDTTGGLVAVLSGIALSAIGAYKGFKKYNSTLARKTTFSVKPLSYTMKDVSDSYMSLRGTKVNTPPPSVSTSMRGYVSPVVSMNCSVLDAMTATGTISFTERLLSSSAAKRARSNLLKTKPNLHLVGNVTFTHQKANDFIYVKSFKYSASIISIGRSTEVVTSGMVNVAEALGTDTDRLMNHIVYIAFGTGNGSALAAVLPYDEVSMLFLNNSDPDDPNPETALPLSVNYMSLADPNFAKSYENTWSSMASSTNGWADEVSFMSVLA